VPSPTHTTGEDIFNLINLYMADKGRSWKHCVDISTDGARSMIGKMCGFIAHVKPLLQNVLIATLLSFHRQAIAV
jgi:hypothetical protein